MLDGFAVSTEGTKWKRRGNRVWTRSGNGRCQQEGGRGTPVEPKPNSEQIRYVSPQIEIPFVNPMISISHSLAHLF